jgi:hypothetical protein
LSHSAFVPIACPQCHAKLVIHLAEEGDSAERTSAHDVAWTCPHCQRSTPVSIFGLIVSVAQAPPEDE